MLETQLLEWRIKASIKKAHKHMTKRAGEVIIVALEGGGTREVCWALRS